MPSIKAHLIFEIMGRPPEKIKEALNDLIIKMGAEKGITILEEKYHDAKPIPDSKDLHTSFVEVEAEFVSMRELFMAIMIYFPANIEVFEPENIKFSSSEFNEMANFLTSRMHHYDAIAKTMIRERDFLFQKLKEAGLVKEKPTEKTPQKKTERKKSKSKK